MACLCVMPKCRAAGRQVVPPPAAGARARRFAAHRGLIGLAVAVPMAEAAVTGAVAPAARLLAPQTTALAPLAAYHDLRWLFEWNGTWHVAGGTWLGFAVPLVGVLAARSALDAALAWLSWPASQARPRRRVFAAGAAAFVLCTGLMMFPVAALAFGVAVLPFSWPFLGAAPLLLLLALLLSHGGITISWWRTLPTVRAAGWLAADFVMLSMLAVLISRLPGGWAIPAAGVGGIINARAWYSVTNSVAAPRPARQRPARQRPVRRWLPVAPAGAIVAVALVVGVAELGITAAAGTHGQRTLAFAGLAVSTGQPGAAGPAPGSAHGQAVLEIAGFGSSCCAPSASLQAIAPGAVSRQFSYRGLDPEGRPLPYGAAATDLPLPALGDRIAAQVEQLHRVTGQPVDLVAESEGTLGVYAMLARHRGLPIGSIVLLSPIIAPGQVSYPTGSRGGPASVPGYALRALVWLIGGLTPYGTSGAGELISSVDSSGALYASEAARETCERPVRWVAIMPLADSLTLPADGPPENTLVVPALHGGLLGSPSVQRLIRSFLAGHPIQGSAVVRQAAGIVAQASAAWRMPELATPALAACFGPPRVST